MTPDPSSPAPNAQRMEHIDLIRGYALLGVLLMNIHFWFRGPMERYMLAPHPYPGWWNMGTDMLLNVGFAGKSVTLFSILFAIGLCMQRESLLARGARWLPFGFRRLAVALGLGALHVTLLWMGDVLHQYALAALLILPFLKRETRTLNRWLLGLFTSAGLGMVIFALIQVGKGPGGLDPTPEDAAKARDMIGTLVRGYTQPGWWEVAKTRLFHYRSALAGILPLILIFTWVNFLVGVRLWKSGLLQDPAAHLPRFAGWARWGIGFGILMGLTVEAAALLTPYLKTHWGLAWGLFPLVALSQVFGALVLALGLGSGLIWLWHQARWRERLRPLTAVGRMGFSNYILQSLVCTWIFHGFGLARYGRTSPLAGLAIGLGLFAVQIPSSVWWLRRYRFGPLEWVWRTLAYGKAPAFRREPRVEAN